MKNRHFILFVLYLLVLPSIGQAQTLDTLLNNINNLLHSHVEYDKVHYHRLVDKPQPLQQITQTIKELDTEKLSRQEQKAFYINAYNLLVIKAVVDNYPILSTEEVLSFWETDKCIVGQKEYTLDELEAFVLSTFNDPRLHFVLSDASVSGAPIPNKAYSLNRLDEQLDAQLYRLFNDGRYLLVNKETKELTLPLVFRWYKEELKTIYGFINKYRAEEVPADYAIRYQDYNYQLNDFGDGPSELIMKKRKNKTKKNPYTTATPFLLIPKNKLEVVSFHNIFTAAYGNRQSGLRNTYYSSFNSFYYGVSDRVNVGVNLIMRSFRENDSYQTSPFKVMAFERKIPDVAASTARTPSSRSDWGLSQIGIQARFLPFKKLNFAFEQAFYFPIRGLPVGNEVDINMYSVSQIYYYQKLMPKLDMLFSLTFWQPITPGQKFKFQIPFLRAYLNWYVFERVYLSLTTTYGVEWGAGVMFRLAPHLELNLMGGYILPIPAVLNLLSQGASQINSYSLGLRYVF